MTPSAAVPVFVVSIAVMLAASALFARRLDHIGLRLGLPETLLGLLTALAADAPEISSAITALVQGAHAVAVGVVVGSNAFNLAAMLGLSAIVAGRVKARHEALELEAFVGLWLIAVTLAVAAGAVDATVGALLVGAVAVPYVALLVVGPRIVRRLPLDAARARFVHRSFGEAHRHARPLDSRREAAQLVGVIVLAILTSLPNAWTGVRFGLQHRGSALMSETLNSNSINIVAGLAIPAALGTLAAFSGLAVFDLAWLFGMTAAALLLFGMRDGGGRVAGTFLVVLYAVFVAVQVAKT